jgi:hypothetical protein
LNPRSKEEKLNDSLTILKVFNYKIIY